MRQSGGIAALVAALIGATAVTFHPARYLGGSLPTVPPLVVGGGQVLLEVTVATTGRIADAKTLRTTPPFAEGLIASLQGWQFRPAERLMETSLPPGAQPEWRPVEARVLVADVVRPPSLNAPTLGQPPADVGVPSSEVPFPIRIVSPPYPPLARDAGTVMVEVTVEIDGSVGAARVVRSAPGFDDVALKSAQQWSFRPARVGGVAFSTYAYLIFVFRQPVT
jgi:TonB family protein